MNKWKSGDWGYSEVKIFENPSIYVYVIDSQLDSVYATGAYMYDPETGYSVSLRVSNKLPKASYSLELAQQHAVEQVLRKFRVIFSRIESETAYVCNK